MEHPVAVLGDADIVAGKEVAALRAEARLPQRPPFFQRIEFLKELELAAGCLGKCRHLGDLRFLGSPESVDLMAQHPDFALEHLARAWRPRDRQTLLLGGNKAFQGGEEGGCHDNSDGLPGLMFTRFDNIAGGTKL